MRSLVLLAMAVTLCSSVGLCQLNDTAINGAAINDTAIKENLNASDLKAMLANSSINLESYRFLLDMDQTTELFNLSDRSNESQKLVSRSFGVGAVNMTGRVLKLVMATVILPIGDDGNATAMGMEEYMVNDTLYLRVDGNWTSLQLPFSEDMWSKRNTLEQQVEMLNSSNITMLGIETVDGLACYKIRADIDLASFASQLSQAGPYQPLQPMNISSLFNNTSLEAYYWIAEDTYLLKKCEVFESMVFRPQELGLPPKGPENIEMHVNADISMIFGGYNESINIALPAEALGAVALPSNTTQPGAAAEIAQAALNETASNETATNETGILENATTEV